VNFASLGYGDIVMSKDWKLLGPLEAVNGVLMVGMSGAALVAVLQQLDQEAAGTAHADGLSAGAERACCISCRSSSPAAAHAQ
jgi:hypothetical protein